MSLSRGELNPLGVLGQRKLTFIPKHFVKISIPIYFSIEIDNWINYNLNGRYAIKHKLVIDQSNKLIETLEIGLEDPMELTMFTLGCPYLHEKGKDLF